MRTAYKNNAVAFTIGLLSLGVVNTCCSQDKDTWGPERPLRNGSYIAPMASYVSTAGNAQIGNGEGGTIALGYRLNWYAIEATGIYTSLSGSNGAQGKPSYLGGSINGLIFPIRPLRDFYAIVSAGGLEVKNISSSTGIQHFNLTTIGGGLGYILPLKLWNYEFGVRAEALYRYGKRDAQGGARGDIDVSRAFDDVLLNVGLQLPLGLRHVANNTDSPPPRVVPVEQPASAPSSDRSNGVLPAAPSSSNSTPQAEKGKDASTASPQEPATDSTELDSILNAPPQSPDQASPNPKQ